MPSIRFLFLRFNVSTILSIKQYIFFPLSFRNPPAIFCLFFTFLKSLSEILLSNGTSKHSINSRWFPIYFSRRFSSVFLRPGHICFRSDGFPFFHLPQYICIFLGNPVFSLPGSRFPIKNMVNAMYAKDMSKKILAAKEAQKRNGNITVGLLFYQLGGKDCIRSIST